MRVTLLALGIALLAHLRLLYDRPKVRPALRAARRSAGTAAAAARGTAASAVRRPIAAVLGIGLLVGLAWARTYWRLTTQGDAVTVLGINDYPKHQRSAHELSLVPFRLDVPQFLYHLVTKATDLALGIRVGDVASMVLFTALAYVGAVLLLREPSRGRGRILDDRTTLMLGATYFVLESPALVAIWLRLIPLDTPFSTVHWWGNPTYLAAVPFTFLSLPLLNRAIDTSEADVVDGHGWRSDSVRWKLLAVVALGTMAKPTFTLVLVPALPTYLVLIRRSRARTLARLGAWAVAPIVAVVAWQSWFLGTDQSPDFQSSLTFDPLVEPIYGWVKAVPVYLFPIALLSLAVWASRGRFLREPSAQISLLALAFAVPLMLTVRETGNKSGEGNMAVPAQACIGVLLLLVFRTFAWELATVWRDRRTTGAALPLWVWVVLPVLALLLAGGVLSILDGSGLIHVYADWELKYQGT